MITASPPYAYEPGYPDDAEAYCEAGFGSYDPASCTYVGYDGRRHPCPSRAQTGPWPQ